MPAKHTLADIRQPVGRRHGFHCNAVDDIRIVSTWRYKSQRRQVDDGRVSNITFTLTPSDIKCSRCGYHNPTFYFKAVICSDEHNGAHYCVRCWEHILDYIDNWPNLSAVAYPTLTPYRHIIVQIIEAGKKYPLKCPI